MHGSSSGGKHKIILPKEKVFLEEPVIFKLEKEEELRIEVGPKEEIKVKVESGFGEIDGAELPRNIALYFTNTKFAIFTWTGAQIKVHGKTAVKMYIGKETPMQTYLFSHYLINEKRVESQINNAIGPRVLVVGSAATGKTTLCHIFLNYAIRLGWNPIYVDLDLSNEIALPGTIAATVIDYNLPVNFSKFKNDFLIDNSVIFYHGYNNLDINYELYEMQVTELSDVVKKKLKFDLDELKKKYHIKPNMSNYENEPVVFSENPTLFASGVIINCPSIQDSSKQGIYNHIITQFEVDIVYVLENEALYNYLQDSFGSGTNKTNIKDLNRQQKSVTVNLLPKNRGVINLETSYKENLDQKKINRYFLGPFGNFNLNEHILNLREFKVLKITASNLTSSFLPKDSSADLKLMLKEIHFKDENLVNRVIALIDLDQETLDQLNSNYSEKLNLKVEKFSKSCVSFFAAVQEYNNLKETIKIQTPAKEIRHKYLLCGNIKWLK